MIEITTWDGKTFTFEIGSTYNWPADRFQKGYTYLVRFGKDRIETIYFLNYNRCGIYYHGYDEYKSQFPYKDKWELITPVPESEFNELKQRIIL